MKPVENRPNRLCWGNRPRGGARGG